MKSASLLRHLWICCLICILFLAATGVAYANATNNAANGKADSSKQELVMKQEDSPNNKIEVASVSTQSATATKAEPKPAEVKKEGATTGFFSFSFLYYLFYKTKFAETTNNAFRNSLNTLISRLLD